MMRIQFTTILILKFDYSYSWPVSTLRGTDSTVVAFTLLYYSYSPAVRKKWTLNSEVHASLKNQF